MSDLNLDEKDFTEEVLQSDVPVLVDFWAEWCAPCQQIAPVIEELAKEYKDKVKIRKVNIDEAKELAATHEVMSIPNLVFFKDGQKVEQLAGSVSKETIEKAIKDKLL
ncbi:MAG: thioredoxin [Parcubacteria group bacterium]|nr:thioredoxin [Parcubacteria group bacterium]